VAGPWNVFVEGDNLAVLPGLIGRRFIAFSLKAPQPKQSQNLAGAPSFSNFSSRINSLSGRMVAGSTLSLSTRGQAR
jgi:hypothetical protein